MARRVDNQPGMEDPKRVGNFELYDFPKDSVAPAMNARRARDTMTYLSFPSRFGSNANVTENQAQSMAHSAGAPAVFRKSSRAQTNEDSETWVEGDVANTLNSFDVGDVRTTHAIVSAAAFKAGNSAAARSIGYEEEMSPSLEAGGGGNNKPTVLLQGANSPGQQDHLLLPVGLDSHRYRCCGNGVVASVAEWIGQRIVAVDVLE
jgi:site-specific DNA-cytosine methylase